MTITTRPAPATVLRLRGSVRRIRSLARAEAAMLRRNPMALVNALGTPVVGVVLLNAFPPSGPDASPGAGVVVSLTAFGLLFPLYYNLVTTLVARREELVLARLRSGECGDDEILVGAATPGMVVSWSQAIVGIVAAMTVLGMTLPANPALVVVAVLLGTVIFVLLAATSTALTRTVEMAQLSTLPVVLASMVLGGLFPPAMLPATLPWVAQALPLTQVVNLVWIGLTGTTREGPGPDDAVGAAAVAVTVLAAWVVAGAVLRRRFMRWEPRR